MAETGSCWNGRDEAAGSLATPVVPDPDLSEAETSEAGVPAAARRSGYYAIFALVAGVGLIAGGLYAYEQLPRPPLPATP